MWQTLNWAYKHQKLHAFVLDFPKSLFIKGIIFFQSFCKDLNAKLAEPQNQAEMNFLIHETLSKYFCLKYWINYWLFKMSRKTIQF